MIYPYLIQSNSGNIEKYLVENRDSIVTSLHTIGAVLLRGFNISTPQHFEDAAKSFQPKLVSYTGGDSPREKVTSNIYTSTSYPSDETISMHQEKSFSNNYPEFVYFFCEIEPKFKGETPIADGRKIYKEMPSDIVDKLSRKKLKYSMNMSDKTGLGRTWQDVFEISSKSELEELLKSQNIQFNWKPNGLLMVEETVNPIISHHITGEKIFFSQAHQWHPSALDKALYSSLIEIMDEEDFYHNCTYGDGSMIQEQDLNIMREIIDQNRIFFTWKQGDLLILDNRISMHGRAPFKGERRILVTMS